METRSALFVRQRRRWALPVVLAVLCVAAVACVPADGSAPPGDTRFDAYRWSRVADDAPWGRRAGVEAVNLNGSFFLVGGRTPNPYTPFPEGPIPGDSTIWGDVWRSDDSGRTWVEVLATEDSPWPARSYHEVVVQGSRMVLLGGQNFLLEPNPACARDLICFPRKVPRSDFFNDVWASDDGTDWELLTEHAPWEGRAGLSAAVLDGEIYVMGGSVNDDQAITFGPPDRKLFNDVWKSSDGINWERATASAPWAPRAGAAVVVKDGYLYLLGGEFAFTGYPPPYFNDVWRTRNGTDWELVTPSAGWSPRPGHTCDVLEGTIVCFGGYGQSPNPLDPFGTANPTDVWTSEDGRTWVELLGKPWNATSQSQIRYDYDTLVAPGGPGTVGDAIYTFGGDRENFNFFDPTQWRRVDDDVWRFALPYGAGATG
ncbi:MAG: hypothetical protein R2716_13700 [Microthrixaceae bacterium]